MSTPTGRSFSFRHLATSGQRHGVARALAMCLALDVVELVDPAAGSAAEMRAAVATTVAVQTWTASDLLAAGITKLALHGARAVTFTTAGGTAADAPATCLITGTDIHGNALSETLALAQTATIVTSVKCYATIVSIVFAAGDGTGATIAMGISDKFGFPSKVKDLTTGVNVVNELEDGAPPTRGTFVQAATSLPNGAYTPDSTPDGALDFFLTYEFDAS